VEDTDVIAQRQSVAILLRRALAGELSRDEVRWPGPDADESVQIAITALGEYFDTGDGPGDVDQAYWDGELSRMAQALESGAPLESDQLAGWRGANLTWGVVFIAVVALLTLVWRLML
jgi:hypothetical protein